MNTAAAAPASNEGLEPSAPDAGGLFSKYSAQVFAYCLHSLGSRSDAEDALQTTFLHAHRALQRGAVPQCESAWLTAIAKNACRWQRRTQVRRATVSEGSVDIAAFPAPEDADRKGAIADLKQALASIPERQRKALLLREWQGLQPSEIAPRLGASTSETYALLTRARRSVATALTAAARRPVLGIDFGSLLLQLRSLFAGAPATIGATAIAIAGVGVAGVQVDHALADHRQGARSASAAVPSAESIPARTRGTVPAAADARARVAFVRAALVASATRRTSRGPRVRASGGGASAPAPRVAPETSNPASSVTPRAETTPPPRSTPPPAPASVAMPVRSPAPASTSQLLPDPALSLPVEVPPPLSTAVSTVTGVLSTPGPTDSPTPPPAPAPSVPPLPQVPPPVRGLLP